MVPVAAEVHGVDGDDHHMAHAWGDLLLAAGAQIGLGGLERLDPPDLDLVQRGMVAHSTASATTTNATATST
jgi:hypothetical protein